MKQVVLSIALLLFNSMTLLITSMASEVSALSITLLSVEAGRPDSRYPDIVFGGQVVWEYSPQGK